MTKIIIRTAKEKVYFEPPKEDAEKLINSWVNGMQPLIKRLEGKPKKSPCTAATVTERTQKKYLHLYCKGGSEKCQ